MTLHDHPAARGVLLEHPDGMVVDAQDDSAEDAARPGARRAVRALRTAGLQIGAVADRDEADQRVDALIGPLDAWVAAGDDDAAREATIRGAAATLGLDTAELVVIGDRGQDMRAAHAAGATSILVPSGRTRDDGVEEADVVVPSLVDAVAFVLHALRRATV
jgi:phosphoglycolate phosphatase-like HAD superfamily hydrolase